MTKRNIFDTRLKMLALDGPLKVSIESQTYYLNNFVSLMISLDKAWIACNKIFLHKLLNRGVLFCRKNDCTLMFDSFSVTQVSGSAKIYQRQDSLQQMFM